MTAQAPSLRNGQSGELKEIGVNPPYPRHERSIEGVFHEYEITSHSLVGAGL
jgi:hypothetical protein